MAFERQSSVQGGSWSSQVNNGDKLSTGSGADRAGGEVGILVGRGFHIIRQGRWLPHGSRLDPADLLRCGSMEGR